VTQTAHACDQAAKIATLEAHGKSTSTDVSEIKSLIRENNKVLEKVAAVISDVRHLHEDSARNEKAIVELFKRVRALEIAPGQNASRAWWLLFGTLTGCAGGVVTGVVVWLVKGAI